MLIRKPVAGFKPVKIVVVALAIAMTLFSEMAQAEGHFHMEKNAQGLILPFKALSEPLSDFVREYARITSTTIASGGIWAEDLKGSVTLLLRHPLKQEELTEIFHRVTNDNGYAVVDAPAGNGWIIVRARDARDLALPVYEIGSVPDTSRLVTVYHDLKYADAEEIARAMRSFMPANSRIIPTTRSQLFITDTGSNIRKLNWIISKMDTEETAKRQRELSSSYTSSPPRTCGEQRIQKLVVENLEIQDGGNNPNQRQNTQQNQTQSAQIKSMIKGGTRK